MLNPNTQAGGLQRMYKRVKVVREVKILWPRKELFSELTRTLGLAMLLHMYFWISASAGPTYLKAEVNISPKMSICALFLHDSKVNSLKPALYHIIHCFVFYFVLLGTALQLGLVWSNTNICGA